MWSPFATSVAGFQQAAKKATNGNHVVHAKPQYWSRLTTVIGNARTAVIYWHVMSHFTPVSFSDTISWLNHSH